MKSSSGGRAACCMCSRTSQFLGPVRADLISCDDTWVIGRKRSRSTASRNWGSAIGSRCRIERRVRRSRGHGKGRMQSIRACISQSSSERRRSVGSTKFRLDTEGACRGLRHKLGFLFSTFAVAGILCRRILILLGMLRRVWVRALDLDETFGAYRLVAASSPIEIWRVVKEANGTFAGIFVEIGFDRLTIHKRIVRQHIFTGRHFGG